MTSSPFSSPLASRARQAPAFWFRPAGRLSAVLQPLACVYAGAGQLRRLLVTPATSPVPLVVVGNIVSGGAGKTPVTLALAQALQARGKKVHLIAKGYGGSLPGPLRVDPERHTVTDVGDEPLLLARQAPTWSARDRGAGWIAASAGADLVVSDDGLQSPRLAPSFALLVMDGEMGVGNGRLIPAGPLRETLAQALPRLNAIVRIGGTGRIYPAGEQVKPGVAVLEADFQLEEAEWMRGARLLPFAGLGRPEKFFDSCRRAGGLCVSVRTFPDHHPYTPEDLTSLVADARQAGAQLVTTRKDAVRLPPAFRPEVRVVSGHLVWRDPAAFDRLVASIASLAHTRAPEQQLSG